MAPKVLVAEDDPSVRTLLEVVLSDDYELDAHEDGRSALDAIEADPHGYACVILDVMMPRMTGLEVLTSIRAEPLTTTLPVIVLTARIAEQEAMEHGADYYVAKPFDPELLHSTIALLLHTRSSAGQVEELERLLHESQ